MFNNAINPHDLVIILEKVRQGALGGALHRIFPVRRKDSRLWDRIVQPLKNWWDIPQVMERWNRLVSGDSSVDYLRYYTGKYLADRKGLAALTVGCGSGHRELEMEELGIFSRIDSIDISRARVEYAKRLAADSAKGRKINYIVGDIFNIELEEGGYDLVLAEQALHHLSPLDTAVRRIEKFLKPGGYLIFNEYVGPPRFQWTNIQLGIVNAILALLPERFRRRWRSGTLKKREYRAGRLLMWLYDPTEAVESRDIIPVLKSRFELLETRGYGGTILMILFRDIAQNFLSTDSDTQRWLDFCFYMEDFFLENGVIEHDFMTGVCRKT